MQNNVKVKKKMFYIDFFFQVLYGYCIVLYVLGTKIISNRTVSEPES